MSFVRRGRGFNYEYDQQEANYGYRTSILQAEREQVPRLIVPLQSVEGWILFVSNLHEETSEDDVREAFDEYGHVLNIHLNLDRRTGFVKGYAFVEFKRYEHAACARENLNQSELLGTRIKVDWACIDKSQY